MLFDAKLMLLRVIGIPIILTEFWRGCQPRSPALLQVPTECDTLAEILGNSGSINKQDRQA